MVCHETHTRMLGGRHFHTTRNGNLDPFFSRGIEDLYRAKTGGRTSRIEDRIPVGLDHDSCKLLPDRAGFDGFTGIGFSITVVVVQNIVMLRVRKKDTDFISLSHGLGLRCQEVRADLSDCPIQAVLRQLRGKPDAAQSQYDRHNTKDNHEFRQRIPRWFIRRTGKTWGTGFHFLRLSLPSPLSPIRSPIKNVGDRLTTEGNL